MKKKHYTITPFWDKGAMKADGTSRIMITVNLNRKQFRITVKLYATKDDFDKAMGGKGGSDVAKELRKDIASYILKAEVILDRMPNVTKDTFIRFFKSEADLSYSGKTDVYDFFKDRKAVMEKEERFGAANNVRCAWYSFKNYRPKLYFEDIDVAFIINYKDYMLKKGCSETTAGMYLRGLRTLYNQVVKDGVISVKQNPFKLVSVGWSEKSKDVLYPDQIKALWEYQPQGLREARGKAFFFFCYLCNGMNFKDAANLKFSSIKGNIISFRRQKTKNTKKVGKEVKVYIHDEAQKIINEWGTATKRPTDYLFPQFNKCRNAKHFNNTVIRYKRSSNGSLAAIGRKLGLDVRLTLGLARHSFATKQKLSETPVSFISDAMGHSSVAITEHYLKSLPDENLKAMSDKLLSF